jgi:phosphohistidine phosphatase
VKTLILLRHAKSDWGAAHDADHERPLAKRGRNAAATMGALLARAGQVPDRVLTSSAVRAQETVRLAVEAGNWECPTEVAPDFYGSSPATVVARVREEDDAAASLLLAGHEPTWSMLASQLMGGGFLRFPTAAMARIDLDIESWSRLEFDKGVLVWFLIPRLIKSLGFTPTP